MEKKQKCDACVGWFAREHFVSVNCGFYQIEVLTLSQNSCISLPKCFLSFSLLGPFFLFCVVYNPRPQRPLGIFLATLLVECFNQVLPTYPPTCCVRMKDIAERVEGTPRSITKSRAGVPAKTRLSACIDRRRSIGKIAGSQLRIQLR